MENNVTVIGGSNIIICAKSDNSIIQRDSNLGHIEFGLGGVGRNLAEELSLLGADVSLLTAVGDDSFGHVATDRADEVGIKLLAEPFSESKTGVFSYVCNNDGTFVVGVDDMSITEKITPQTIEENINAILFSDYVVMEANLTQDTINKIAEYDVKLVADCVSGRKCKRMSDVLDRLYLLKCNSVGALEFTGMDSCEDAVREFAKRGLKRGVITLNSKGAMCFEVLADGIHTYKMSNMPDREIIDQNGSSDAFLAGFLFALMRDHNMKESLVYGQSTSLINSRCLATVNKEMSFSLLKETVVEFKSKVEIVENTIKV